MSLPYQKLAGIALAGAAGALARYALAGAVQRGLGSSFPWGTAVVNVLGCLLFGVVWAVAAERWPVSSEMRTILLVGFMGSFTTFSTFASETGRLMADSEWALGMGNILLQVTVGIGAVFLGLAIGRAL
ncbi:MAG: CrcB family protein [Candidatus Hydrogenedentes bacterium]|nr:CrcB family protein [Candidatus Hydrogenedentota bacterium]